MKSHLYIIASLFFLTSCQEEPNKVAEFESIPENNSKEEIIEVLRNQQNAWNRGDVKGFMHYYLNSEDLTFTGSSGVVKGHKQVLDRYLKNYDNPEKMGTLKFNVLEFREISPSAAYVLGEWALKRNSDNPTGYFTLVWQKVNGEWKIIHDHTS
jgi:ketosteroid isomerase-like protein